MSHEPRPLPQDYRRQTRPRTGGADDRASQRASRNRTLQIDIVHDRQQDRSTTVLPTEYARAPTYRNPPGAAALKILHALIKQAGERIGEPLAWHEMPLRQAVSESKIRHLTAEEADRHLTELKDVQLSYWIFDVRHRKTIVARGGVIDRAEIHIPKDRSQPVLIRWVFGSMFVDIARSSNFYTLIDNNAVWSFGSRYTISLFQYISALSGQRKRRARFTIAELRDMLGVSTGRLQRFPDLKARALNRAVSEINACEYSRWTVAAETIRVHRHPVAVEISWQLRQPREGQRLLDLHDDPETLAVFPSDGTVRGTAWEPVARKGAPASDPDDVGRDFARWIRKKKGQLAAPNIAKSFRTFASGYESFHRQASGPAPEQGTDRSPLCSFPADGRIRGTTFEAIATRHAPTGSDPDSIGEAYARQQSALSPSLLNRPAGVSHEAEFTAFCQEWQNVRATEPARQARPRRRSA